MTVRDTTEYGYSLNQSQADHGPRSTVHGPRPRRGGAWKEKEGVHAHVHDHVHSGAGARARAPRRGRYFPEDPLSGAHLSMFPHR